MATARVPVPQNARNQPQFETVLILSRVNGAVNRPDAAVRATDVDLPDEYGPRGLGPWYSGCFPSYPLLAEIADEG